MAPKGGNAKKESGRAKKAESEAKKKQLAEEEKEKKEQAKWDTGAKGKAAKEEKEAKRKEALAAKAERDRLLAEEEAAVSSKPKATPKAAAKKKAGAPARSAGPGAIAAGGGLAAVSPEESGKGGQDEIESFAATGVDDAIAMLEVVNAKMDKASLGQQAAGLEKHPERRFKAAFEAYQDRELPNLRKDHPGLRLNQYKELLFKQFQKSPENPFNQSVVAYDASKDERLEVLERRNREIEERLRDHTKELSLDD